MTKFTHSISKSTGGLDPEEAKLFVEFQSFVTAIVEEVTNQTILNLNTEINKLVQSVDNSRNNYIDVTNQTIKQLDIEAKKLTENMDTATEQSVGYLNSEVQKLVQSVDNSRNNYINVTNRTIKQLDIEAKKLTENMDTATEQSAGYLNSEVQKLAQTIANSRTDYINLFTPVLEEAKKNMMEKLHIHSDAIAQTFIKLQKEFKDEINQSITHINQVATELKENNVQLFNNLQKEVKNEVNQNLSQLEKFLKNRSFYTLILTFFYIISFIAFILITFFYKR